jgi:hypothetical protein
MYGRLPAFVAATMVKYQLVLEKGYFPKETGYPKHTLTEIV